MIFMKLDHIHATRQHSDGRGRGACTSESLLVQRTGHAGSNPLLPNAQVTKPGTSPFANSRVSVSSS